MKFSLRVMTAGDIPAGLRLSRQNNWNQLEADWRRQLEFDPAGCFLAEQVGNVIGTACACCMGDVAWIALVLVDSACRGQGIGTALMRRTLEYVDRRGVSSVRLDATPLGKPIYEKLGFEADFTLHRYGGYVPRRLGAAPVVPAARPEDIDDVIALDRAATSTDRSVLLRRLYQERPEDMLVNYGRFGLDGFVAARPGAHAWQIGPCVGSADGCPDVLLAAMCQRHEARTLFIDVPEENAWVAEFLRDFGLHVQRPLLRMTRGKKIKEDLTRYWTSFGPEKG